MNSAESTHRPFPECPPCASLTAEVRSLLLLIHQHRVSATLYWTQGKCMELAFTHLVSQSCSHSSNPGPCISPNTFFSSNIFLVQYNFFFFATTTIKHNVCACAQSCLTLCNPTDCSPPSSSAHGIPQARILGWVAISSSRGASTITKE